MAPNYTREQSRHISQIKRHKAESWAKHNEEVLLLLDLKGRVTRDMALMPGIRTNWTELDLETVSGKKPEYIYIYFGSVNIGGNQYSGSTHWFTLKTCPQDCEKILLWPEVEEPDGTLPAARVLSIYPASCQ